MASLLPPESPPEANLKKWGQNPKSVHRFALNVQRGLAQEASLSLQPGPESELLRCSLEPSQDC